MSTYLRKRPLTSDKLPDGYRLEFHEIRGYDSPDKWYVAHGPDGWKQEFGESRDAIRACVHRAKIMSPLGVPDEVGVLECYLCRGTKNRVRGWKCPVCGGTNEVQVFDMAMTHDGKVRLAAIAGPMLKDGVLPEWMKLLPDVARGDVETIARNPCKRCGTWLLEPEWIGSAYCSRRCCVDDHKFDPHYASSMLEDHDRGTDPMDDP